MDFSGVEKEVVNIFRKELLSQGKKVSDLNRSKNPNSTIAHSRIFAIFNNTHRLAFADFIEICHLLDLNPSEVLFQIFPFKEKPKLSNEDRAFLEKAMQLAKEILEK